MRPVVHIGTDGIGVENSDGAVLDVLLDGRRVWSFRPAVPASRRDGALLTPWPDAMRRFLDGVAEVAVRDLEGEVLATARLAFGDSSEPVEVVDRYGRPLVVGPNGRMMLGFGDHADATAGLLVAADEVLEVMTSVGLDGFLAYGTLLGAVREGAFIGHDNDLDLGYLSEARHPVDVVHESMRLQRALVRAGMKVERYSGAGLKVWVRDDSGIARGLDIFGGFWDGDRLVLLGELWTPFRREWVEPLSTVELEGHPFPAPAQPERLLEAMYGPDWQVPDPTFSFDPESEGRRRTGIWFRGIRWHRNGWDRWYAPTAADRPMIRQHELATVVHEAEPEAAVLDVGCGRGRDVAYLAANGHRAYGLDYSAPAMRFLTARVREHGWPATYHDVNLAELRCAVAWGARFAREDGPRVIMARHFVDSTGRRARDGMWRLASMSLRGGGRLYLDFLANEEPRPVERENLIAEVAPSTIAEDAEAYGGSVVHREWIDPIPFERPPLTPDWDGPVRSCRMVVEWK